MKEVCVFTDKSGFAVVLKGSSVVVATFQTFNDAVNKKSAMHTCTGVDLEIAKIIPLTVSERA